MRSTKRGRCHVLYQFCVPRDVLAVVSHLNAFHFAEAPLPHTNIKMNGIIQDSVSALQALKHDHESFSRTLGVAEQRLQRIGSEPKYYVLASILRSMDKHIAQDASALDAIQQR